MQGEKQQDLGFVYKCFFFFFGKAHKSKRICEALFDVAKFQRKKCHIERNSQGELHGKEKEEEKRAKCYYLQEDS